jgi:hypothetical protein
MVSRSGVMPLSHTQDIAGPLARTVADLAVALDVSVGTDPNDSVTRILATRPTPKFSDSLDVNALRGARIGILANYFTDTDAEIADSIRSAIRAMKAAGADTVRVDIPGFDSLLANTSVINYEHKYDMIDYLAKTPSTPIRSISDIIAGGFESEALEARFRLADSVGTRDSEPYRRALARQASNRARIVAIMDSLRVDALVYPTMRRKPVFFGDTQLGTTCALSAQTGLPALSIPAGFTGDGLPTGIELLGRPFSDVRLVSIGYAFEKLGPRRRAPFTTPALVRGRAPASTTFSTVVRGTGNATTATFVYDPTRSTLRYDVTVAGVPAAKVQAVTLRRRDASGRTRVAHVLAGAGAASGSGTATLTMVNRNALESGNLVMSVMTTTTTTPIETRIVLPRGGVRAPAN